MENMYVIKYHSCIFYDFDVPYVIGRIFLNLAKPRAVEKPMGLSG